MINLKMVTLKSVKITKIKQNTWGPVVTEDAEDGQKLWELQGMSESGANALNFDHISQLSSDPDQKMGIV